MVPGALHGFPAARRVRYREKLERIVMFCAGHPELKVYSWLFIVTYAFLLRLPSEALHIMTGDGDSQARLTRHGAQVRLHLRRRCGLA